MEGVGGESDRAEFHHRLRPRRPQSFSPPPSTRRCRPLSAKRPCKLHDVRLTPSFSLGILSEADPTSFPVLGRSLVKPRPSVLPRSHLARRWLSTGPEGASAVCQSSQPRPPRLFSLSYIYSCAAAAAPAQAIILEAFPSSYWQRHSRHRSHRRRALLCRTEGSHSWPSAPS